MTEVIPKRKQDVTNNELTIPGYNQFINQNPKRGVAIYTKSKLNAIECLELHNSAFEESTWISVTDTDDKSTLIGCIYKSPNSSKENEEELYRLIRNDYLSKFDKVCLVGDFNYPNIDWTKTNVGTKGSKLIDSINDAFLTQMVKKPSRHREGQKSNLLDLIKVNYDQMISDITHLGKVIMTFYFLTYM